MEQIKLVLFISILVHLLSKGVVKLYKCGQKTSQSIMLNDHILHMIQET